MTKRLLKSTIADQLVQSFASDSDDKMYLFIGKSLPWTDEEAPDSYVDSVESFNDVWSNIISAKRITAEECLLMVKKNSWVSGTTYTEFDSSIDLFADTSIQFYVTNSENNVYKCLHNGGVSSTDSPRGIQLDPMTMSDGYVWKFMFKITESLQLYITDDYIPVKTLQIEEGKPIRYSDDRHLQYSAQYNAVGGSIESISVVSSDAYGDSVVGNASGIGSSTSVTDAGTNYVSFNPSAVSSEDDKYNTYSVSIVSGTGVGQVRIISDYDGFNRKATISENWDVVPVSADTATSTEEISYFEISPAITISGDGVSAEASASINATKQITKITMSNIGKDYKQASATVTTSIPSGGCTLDVRISPKGGHSSNPIEELLPTRLMIVARLQRDEFGTFPVVNDFRQYGIIKNPIINTGYTGAGKIAGSEIDIFSDIKIKSVTSDSYFKSGSYENGEIVFGTESQACGLVDIWNRSTDFTRGTLRLKNVYGKFKTDEKVISVNNTSADIWTSASKDVGFVEFQSDSYLSQSSNNYRLSTRMVVGTTSGAVEDLIVTGSSSGSTASIVSYSTITGSTFAELLVTGINRNGTADSLGFSVGEFVSGMKINTIQPPYFVEGSGTVLYINNTTPISRHFEQEEELRIIIDL